MIDISVILFYNRKRQWLCEARQSYYIQEFSGKPELIEIYKDQSTSKNLNEGCRQAKGKYIKYLCDDDLLLPGALQRLFNHAEKTGADVVCAASLNFNNETRELKEYQSKIPETVSGLAENNTIHGGSTLFRHSALKKVGYFDESLQYGEEYDLYLRLAAHGYSFSQLNKLVYFYRMHNDMKSMQTLVTSGEDYLKRKRVILHDIQEKYFGNNSKIVTQ